MAKKKADRLVVEEKEKGLAVFSYDGVGLALRIGDKDIDTVFEVAKQAIKKQQEKTDGRQEEGKEVRTEGEELESSSTESVAGDTSTGGVSSEVHGPEESDIR